jgi:hypothetical protein
MSALFGLWELIGAPGVGFVNFVESFSSPYTTEWCYLRCWRSLIAGLADRPRGRIAAAVRHRVAAGRIGDVRLATAGHGGACRSTGGDKSGDDLQLAAPGAVTPPKQS